LRLAELHSQGRSWNEILAVDMAAAGHLPALEGAILQEFIDLAAVIAARLRRPFPERWMNRSCNEI
jgi:hypothetical protein